MSYSLNPLKGEYIGDYVWDYYKGYTRSLDYSLYGKGTQAVEMPNGAGRVYGLGHLGVCGDLY